MTTEPITLTSRRLWLRPWRPEDAAPFAALSADPAVMAYLPSCLDAAAAWRLAERCQSYIDRQGWGFWALERRDTGEFIGLTGLHRFAAHLPIAPGLEVGWRLARAFWHQGYAKEAAETALDFAFQQLQEPWVCAFTSEGNRASWGLMERLGMARCPEDFDHPDFPPGHPLARHRLYRIAAQDWRRRVAEVT